MGDSGLATSFFNEKNRNVVKDLLDLLVESNQEVPSWLESMASEVRNSSTRMRGGSRGKGYRNGGFGGRDYRQIQQQNNTNRKSYSMSIPNRSGNFGNHHGGNSSQDWWGNN